jgi:transposase-like protein/DDE family transposase
VDFTSATPVSRDFDNADLGDRRLSHRLARIIDAAELAPGSSLPQRAGSTAALEGTYRFFANKKVTSEVVFGAHVHSTVARAAAEPTVLVLHDTTEFRFGGEESRDGMGWLNSEHKQGFLAHFSICVALTGRPLGSVGLHAWVRQGARASRTKKTADLHHPDRESQRWLDAALLAAERLHGTTPCIHVMDREGDQFELLSMLVDHDQRFVVRLAHDRRLKAGRGRTGEPMLFESLSGCPLFFAREVALAARAKPTGSNKINVFPQRRSRTARLEVRAGEREIFSSHKSPAHVPISLRLRLVEVRETNPPCGEAPIVWRLITTEPIATEHDVAAVIDAYRQRWLIEEFFKALKTGCRYQQLQLESFRALLIALSIESAIAWKLLLMRWCAQHHPNVVACNMLPPEYVSVLRELAAVDTGQCVEHMDSRTALLEVARLGGHIKNNGPPGWIVLRRGLDILVAIHRGWSLAQRGVP